MRNEAAQAAQLAADPHLASAHARLIAERDVQFDLPTYVAPTPPTWLEPLIKFLQWLSPAFSYIFWGALIAAALVILYLVATNADGIRWRGFRRKAKGAGDANENWQPNQAKARALLAEAEALAREGRYAEAARLLLRRSVEDIADRLPQFLKPSLTARDIAGADALPAAARPAFAAIARVVEVSAFGSRAVTADAWDDCRRAYGEFAIDRNWAHG